MRRAVATAVAVALTGLATASGAGAACQLSVEWRERVYELSEQPAGELAAPLGTARARPCDDGSSQAPDERLDVFRIDGVDAEEAIAIANPPRRLDRALEQGRGSRIALVLGVIVAAVVAVELGRRRMRRRARA
jgi:hypothetical protein